MFWWELFYRANFCAYFATTRLASVKICPPKAQMLQLAARGELGPASQQWRHTECELVAVVVVVAAAAAVGLR